MYVCVAEINGFDAIEDYEIGVRFFEEEAREWVEIHHETYPHERAYGMLIPYNSQSFKIISEKTKTENKRSAYMHTLRVAVGLMYPNRCEGSLRLSSERNA